METFPIFISYTIYLFIFQYIPVKRNQETMTRVSAVPQRIRNLTSIHENTGSIPGLAQWVKDTALLWLWCRPAAVGLIQPLAWDPPYAVHVHPPKKKIRQKNKITIERLVAARAWEREDLMGGAPRTFRAVRTGRTIVKAETCHMSTPRRSLAHLRHIHVVS